MGQRWMANVQHLKVQSCPMARSFVQREQNVASLHMVQIEAGPKKLLSPPL